MRALEDAQYEFATAEKFRLEDKQRRAAKAVKAAGRAWTPRWFDRAAPAPGEEDAESLVKGDGLCAPRWAFNERYWAARAAQDWSESPDIFGPALEGGVSGAPQGSGGL